MSDVRAQLKVLQQIQLEETKRRTERERAQLLKEAKSRSKQTNSEAKAKAKQVTSHSSIRGDLHLPAYSSILIILNTLRSVSNVSLINWNSILKDIYKIFLNAGLMGLSLKHSLHVLDLSPCTLLDFSNHANC